MRIVCTLPNAGDEISGIKFETLNGDAKVSVGDVPDEMVKHFLAIDGYAIFEEEPKAPEAPKPAAGNKKKAAEAATAAAPDAAQAAPEGDAAAAGEGQTAEAK